MVSHGKGLKNRTLLFIMIALGGMVLKKTMTEALSISPKAVMGYAIDNNLLGAHGWGRVRVLVQKTSDEKMLDKIKRRVGQLEKAAKARMDPKSIAQRVKDARARKDPMSPTLPDGSRLKGTLIGNDSSTGVVDKQSDDADSPDFLKTFTKLKWECLRTGVSLAALQCPFPKPLIYKQLHEDLTMHQIAVNLTRQKTRHLKQFGKQEPLCAMPLEQYELMSSTQQFAFEKAIESERRWAKLSLDVCHVCQGCHLTKMKRTMVEVGHSTAREKKPICGSCSNNPLKNTPRNRVVPYWLDAQRNVHTNVPNELSCLTFAEKQLIALASAHMSLIHIKNGTLGSRGHCVSVEQKISELFLTLPRKPGDLNILHVRRSGRSSDHEVYEKIFKVRKDKVLAALYWLVKHNVLYQEYNVQIDPSRSVAKH